MLASLGIRKQEWEKEARRLSSANSIKNIRTYNDDDYLDQDLSSPQLHLHTRSFICPITQRQNRYTMDTGGTTLLHTTQGVKSGKSAKAKREGPRDR